MLRKLAISISLVALMLMICGSGRMRLTWARYDLEESPDVEYLALKHGYFTYEDSSMTIDTISPISPLDTVFVTNVLEHGYVHRFWMVAVDSAGNVSNPSDVVQKNLINPAIVDSLKGEYIK